MCEQLGVIAANVAEALWEGTGISSSTSQIGDKELEKDDKAAEIDTGASAYIVFIGLAVAMR